MNILVVHTSPRGGGNSAMLAEKFIEGAKDAGHDVHLIEVGNVNIAGCKACEYCFKHDGACAQKDDMQKFYPQLHWADAVIYATPMYYYSFPAQMRAFQDRQFCGIGKSFNIKYTGLLLCFEDKDKSTCDHAVGTFRVAADYCKYEILGEVIANNVYEKGAIAGNTALQEAYDFGRGIKE